MNTKFIHEAPGDSDRNLYLFFLYLCNYLTGLSGKVQSSSNSSGSVGNMHTEDHLWKRRNNLFQFSHSCKASVCGFLASVWFQRNTQFICIFPNVGCTVLPRCQQTPTHWRRLKTKPSSSSRFMLYQFFKINEIHKVFLLHKALQTADSRQF